MSWQDKLRQVEPYVAGEQPKINNMIKLNTNENPYGPCKQIKDILKEIDIEKLKLYPNSDGEELRHALAKYHGLKDEQVFLGNGSDEVLALTFLTFFNGSDPVLFPNISYSFYPVYCDLYQMNYKEIILDQDFKMYVEDFKQPNSGIIFPNPNAPTGLLVSLDFIEEVLKSNPDSIVVVDEAYIDFGGQSCVPLIHQYENLVVIQTFSKSRSFAGARLGVALGNKEAISHLYDVKNSFNSYPIDYITQQIGLVSVLNSQDMKEKCQKVIQTREYTKTKLKELGFVVPDSYANFVFVKHPKIDGEELFLALRKEGIIVRHWNKPLIDQYLSPFGRDVVAEIGEACYKHGLKMGLYYSQDLDWHEPNGGGYLSNHIPSQGVTWENSWDFPDTAHKNFDLCFENKIYPQVEELLRNYGDLCLIWFDMPMTLKENQSRALFDAIKKYQPDCLINSRLGNGAYDYVSLGDNEIPDSMPENVEFDPSLMNGIDGFKPSPYGLYETAATMNDSWGFCARDQHWKDAAVIAANKKKLNGMGINYLLNVGPDGLGRIPLASQKILREVAKTL